MFEGLAVGLEEDITDVWTLFGGNFFRGKVSIFSEALSKVNIFLNPFRNNLLGSFRR